MSITAGNTTPVILSSFFFHPARAPRSATVSLSRDVFSCFFFIHPPPFRPLDQIYSFLIQARWIAAIPVPKLRHNVILLSFNKLFCRAPSRIITRQFNLKTSPSLRAGRAKKQPQTYLQKTHKTIFNIAFRREIRESIHRTRVSLFPSPWCLFGNIVRFKPYKTLYLVSETNESKEQPLAGVPSCISKGWNCIKQTHDTRRQAGLHGGGGVEKNVVWNTKRIDN